MRFPTVEESRARLLEAIDPTRALTLIRAPGNRGDELIAAGFRELLADCVYEELDADAAARVTGDTAVIVGSGAWCRTYHRTLPALLGIVERHFERVVVLPSSFEPEEDVVRAALERTSATVFARESESYRLIAGLCDARLAHDGAFFFDLTPWARRPAEGTLLAFRTDHETSGEAAVPPGNDDISATAPDLDAWLDAIARHEHVRTDRAHVMIAAALMGRSVEWVPGSYHKLRALAATLPAGAEVTRGAAGPPPAAPAPPPAPGRDRLLAAAARAPAAATVAAADGAGARVCAVILSRDRPHLLPAAVGSALAAGPGVEVLVVDQNSGPATHAVLDELERRERVAVERLAENLGCGAGRQRAAESVEAELLLLLDDDAELLPGALPALVAELDAHPDAQAVTPLVAGPDGAVVHCGGALELGEDLARFTIDGFGLDPGDPGVPPTGPADWGPGCGLLVRRSALLEHPMDPGMHAYYEDNEWSLRVRLAAGRSEPFRRCREAVVLHHMAGRSEPETDIAFRDGIARRLGAHARFLERHGVLLHSGGEEIRAVLDPHAAAADPAQARLLLRLVTAYGPEWLLAEWMGGDLAAVLAQAEAARAAARELEAAREELAWLRERHSTLVAVEQGGWWRLRDRLQPAARAADRVRDRLRP